MKNYIAIEIDHISDEESDLLVGVLSSLGFDGFEQGDKLLTSYVEFKDYDQEALDDVALQFKFSYKASNIEEQNWNQLWESNFEPILVGKFVGIRANFHAPIQDVAHEIIITPKMSFGTGHHATTYMMVQQMQKLPFKSANVFDFGTGTGLLAILAEKMGATKIIAVDNDEWSIWNTEENIAANDCSKIELYQTDHAIEGQKFDIILANINKNVIVDNFQRLVAGLAENGQLLLSGLLAEDEKDIQYLAHAAGLTHINIQNRAQWISILYSK